MIEPDEFLEMAYEVRTEGGDWPVAEDCGCDQCGAAPHEGCYEDCPYQTGKGFVE